MQQKNIVTSSASKGENFVNIIFYNYYDETVSEFINEMIYKIN